MDLLDDIREDTGEADAPLSLVIGSAITILDLLVYLMHRTGQALARTNEELAELRERFEKQCAARHDATPHVPVDWSAFYASMGRLPPKPRDLRLN